MSKRGTLDLKECPHCGCQVRTDRYVRHIEKQHSPDAIERKAMSMARQQARQERIRAEGNRIIRCDICNARLKTKNIKKHKQRIHQHPIHKSYLISKDSPQKKKYPDENKLLLWEGPEHQTRFIKKPINVSILKKQAQRLSIELGPDNHRVRILKKQIYDMENGRVKRGSGR